MSGSSFPKEDSTNDDLLWKSQVHTPRHSRFPVIWGSWYISFLGYQGSRANHKRTVIIETKIPNSAGCPSFRVAIRLR